MEPPKIEDLWSRLNKSIRESMVEDIAYRQAYDTTADVDYGGYIPPGSQGGTESVFYEEEGAARGDQSYVEVESPTATSNFVRPRTLAAAYNHKTQTLTIIFPDGTNYNYYEVPGSVWTQFKQKPTKGAYIKDVLDNYPRGPADMTGIGQDAMQIKRRQDLDALTLRRNQVNQGMKDMMASGVRPRRTSGRYKKR